MVVFSFATFLTFLTFVGGGIPIGLPDLVVREMSVSGFSAPLIISQNFLNEVSLFSPPADINYYLK